MLSLDGSVVLLRDNAKFGSKAGESEDARVDWEVDNVEVGSSSSGETQESNRLISHATMLNEGGANGSLGRSALYLGDDEKGSLSSLRTRA
jgi:hypothetical protein